MPKSRCDDCKKECGTQENLEMHERIVHGVKRNVSADTQSEEGGEP